MKKNLLLIIVLLVLLGLWYFVIREQAPVVSVDRPLVEVDMTAITQIKIDGPEHDATLVKQGGMWTVKLNGKHYPANEQMLGNALDRLTQLSKKALVSEREAKFTDFEVDDSAGVKLTVTGQGEPLELYLGKAGPTFQTSYVRLGGSKETWEISGNHRGTFSRDASAWRDKTINKYNMDDFTKFELIYPDETITLTKQDTLWNGTANGEAFDSDANLVERLARMMSSINTVEFADTLAEDAFAEPEAEVIAELAGGKTVKIRLMKKDEDKYYLRKAGAMTDYVVHNATANALMRKVDDLKVKPDDSE